MIRSRLLFAAAFEAQFPKAEATAAAIELERLVSHLGIDLVPEKFDFSIPEEPPSGESDDPPEIKPPERLDRDAPTKEATAAFEAISGNLGAYLDREIKSTREHVGAPPPALERYLARQGDRFAAIEALLLGGSPVRWESNVREGWNGPRPNLMGRLRLQRLLIARVLLLARRQEMEGALRTLEAAWRLNDVLSARPEMICQLIVVAMAKLQLGVVRKLDTPAESWAERLRSRSLFHRYLAALQNDVWFSPEEEETAREIEAYARARQQVAREYSERDPCSWTPSALEEVWKVAARDHFPEESVFLSIAMPNLIDEFARWARFLIDSELTALILDARAERAASRQRAWPSRLTRLGTGVCPNEKWSYRLSADGTAAFAFEGQVIDMPSAALRLPLAFTAGEPVSPAKKPKVESGYVRGADGVRLFHRKVVDGGPVAVLLHGGPGSSMNGVWPDLEPLGKGRTVVMYDQRGGGRSQILQDPARLTAQHHVRDLEAVRLALRLDRFTLIGESWGSLLAVLYASEHPDRVERLVLIGPAPPTRAIMERRLDESDETMGMRRRLAEISRAMPGAKDPINLCREFFGLYMKQFFVRPEAIPSRRGSSCDGPPEGVRNYFVVNQATLASLGDFDVRPQLSRLRILALVIEGEKSIPTTVESARAFASALPRATLVLVPDAGHYPQVERPDLFFPAVEKFLSGNREAP